MLRIIALGGGTGQRDKCVRSIYKGKETTLCYLKENPKGRGDGKKSDKDFFLDKKPTR